MTNRTIKVGTADINVIETGVAETALVFLHYWGGTARTYEPIMEKLSDDFHCVAFDQRGWGKSSRDGDFSLDGSASDTVEVVKALGLNRYILIGHSRSGKVAQLVAAAHPKGLAGLILLGSAPANPLPVPEGDRRGFLELYQTREGVEKVLQVITKAPLPKHIQDQTIEDIVDGSFGAKEAWTTDGMIEDITTSAKKIAVPTLAVVGSDDQVIPFDLAQSEIPKSIPHVKFEVIDGVGHLPPLEAPEKFADIVRRFVNSL